MSKKKDVKSSKRASRTDTVRSAVDQAFQATAQATADAGLLTRGRATEIADELVGNITRLRDALEDARPASTEDLKALRADMAALAERLDRLEGARAAGAVTGLAMVKWAYREPGTKLDAEVGPATVVVLPMVG